MKATVHQGAGSSTALDPSWKSILECASQEVFDMMAGVHLDIAPDSTDAPAGDVTAMVGLAGALCGMVILRCSGAAAGKFAAAMLGGDGASNSTMRDALGELCNMIAGNFKAKITSLADRCLLSVPTVISGEDYSLSPQEPSDGFNVALKYNAERIWVSLFTQR